MPTGPSITKRDCMLVTGCSCSYYLRAYVTRRSWPDRKKLFDEAKHVPHRARALDRANICFAYEIYMRLIQSQSFSIKSSRIFMQLLRYSRDIIDDQSNEQRCQACDYKFLSKFTVYYNV